MTGWLDDCLGGGKIIWVTYVLSVIYQFYCPEHKCIHTEHLCNNDNMHPGQNHPKLSAKAMSTKTKYAWNQRFSLGLHRNDIYRRCVRPNYLNQGPVFLANWGFGDGYDLICKQTNLSFIGLPNNYKPKMSFKPSCLSVNRSVKKQYHLLVSVAAGQYLAVKCTHNSKVARSDQDHFWFFPK